MNRYTHLSSNQNAISIENNRIGKLEYHAFDTPIEVLVDSYKKQGYLWIKGILDRGCITDFHRSFLNKLSQNEVFFRISKDSLRWESYRQISESKNLSKIISCILKSPVRLMERKIIRCKYPHSPHTDTGAHYDFTYIRCGSPNVATCWIPLGDVPVEMGGLVYLENSHPIGIKLESEMRSSISTLPKKRQDEIISRGMAGKGWITKDLESLAESYNSRWLIGDYEAGDVVIHSPFIIHASLTNQSHLNQPRLSTDIRFSSTYSRIDSRWNKAWELNDGL